MMCRDDIIGGLQFTAGMVTFNPLDGEAIAPEDLNEQDKLTYDACMGAIDLLKAQRPRVLTLEELKESDDPIFFETQSGIIYDWAIKCTANGKHVFLTIRNSTIQAFRIDRYGISWRCWTSRPTNEQRKAVEWDA